MSFSEREKIKPVDLGIYFMFKRLKRAIEHRVGFWNSKNLKSVILKHGKALLIIFIVWEIIEDIIFPAIAYLLGNYVNPAFYAAMPVAWLFCLHPVAVPLIWAVYCKMSGNNLEADKVKETAKDMCGDSCGLDHDHHISD